MLVLGHEGVRERAVAQGIPFETFAHQFQPTTSRSLPRMMIDFATLAQNRRLGLDVMAAARRHCADAVVVDVLLVAAISEVMSSGVPTVVFVHCFYRAIQDLAAGPLGWWLRIRGTNPLAMERNGALQIVSARTELDPVRGRPPVRHVGVIWQGVPTAATESTTPRILVSLSTCAFAGQERMLQNILDAVAPLPVTVIVTVGPAIDPSGLRVPANAALHAWLDHDSVLTSTSVVVGHGGHSTSMRALSFGVPLVVLPANNLIDQRRVGAALQKHGAGILLRKYAKPARIRAAITAILRDPRYRDRAGRIGADIRHHDGANVATEVITRYVESR